MAVTVHIQRFCNQFLTRPTFAVDQDRGVGISDFAQPFKHGLDLGTVADNITEIEFLFKDFLQLDIFNNRGAVFQGPAHDQFQFRQFEGFNDVIISPAFHSFNGGFGRREGRDDDNRQINIFRPAGTQYA